ITVGAIHSGTKENIIPDEAHLEGTIRTLNEATRKRAKTKVLQVSQGVARAFGAKAVVEFEKDAYPVTVNDARVTEQAMKILKHPSRVSVRPDENSKVPPKTVWMMLFFCGLWAASQTSSGYREIIAASQIPPMNYFEKWFGPSQCILLARPASYASL